MRVRRLTAALLASFGAAHISRWFLRDDPGPDSEHIDRAEWLTRLLPDLTEEEAWVLAVFERWRDEAIPMSDALSASGLSGEASIAALNRLLSVGLVEHDIKGLVATDREAISPRYRVTTKYREAVSWRSDDT